MSNPNPLQGISKGKGIKHFVCGLERKPTSPLFFIHGTAGVPVPVPQWWCATAGAGQSFARCAGSRLAAVRAVERGGLVPSGLEDTFPVLFVYRSEVA